MVSQPQRYRISAEEYDRMVEAGVFRPDVRLELMDGEIVKMAPMGARHAHYLWLFEQVFAGLQLARQVVIYTQRPLRLPGDYRPEPDLMLLRPRPGGYEALPTPEDVLLIVEVAETTLDHDRRKALVYASAGIPEYWLVNLDADPLTATIYRDPQLDGYHSIQVVRAGDPLAPVAFPDLAVDTNVLLR